MKGRPVTIRLSDSEFEKLLARAAEDADCIMKKSGRPSLSSYIRKCLFYSGNQPENLKAELRDLDFQVRKAGVNINQAAHRINAGYGSHHQVEQLLYNQERIMGLLARILSAVQEKMEERK